MSEDEDEDEPGYSEPVGEQSPLIGLAGLVQARAENAINHLAYVDGDKHPDVIREHMDLAAAELVAAAKKLGECRRLLDA